MSLFTHLQSPTPTLPQRAPPGWAAGTTSGSFQSRQSCMPNCGVWARLEILTPIANLVTTTTALWALGRAASVALPCSVPYYRHKQGAMAFAPFPTKQLTIRNLMGRRTGRRWWCQKLQNRRSSRQLWWHPHNHLTASQQQRHHQPQRKRQNARRHLALPRLSSTRVPTPPPARQTAGETESEWERREKGGVKMWVKEIRLTEKCDFQINV